MDDDAPYASECLCPQRLEGWPIAGYPTAYHLYGNVGWVFRRMDP